MTKTKYLLIFLPLLLLIIAAVLFLTNGKQAPISKRPGTNVILIVIDTLRADHLGCYGYHRNTSPEMDKLAKEGIIFTDMCAQSSWTKPATASILSGLFPKNHGAHTTEDYLADEINLFPEILGKHGYRSYAFVTNMFVSDVVGFDQGYNKFVFFDEKIERGDIYLKADGLNNTLLPFIHQLEDTSNNFIYIHYTDPHYPYYSKEKYFSKSNKTTKFGNVTHLAETLGAMNEEEQRKILEEMVNAYDDEILFTDKMIGNLVQALKKKNMYSNSIIIITSDHGEEFFEHGNFTHGKTLYDEQLRVPLIIRSPGSPPGVIKNIANQVDILPTTLSLLDIPIPGHIDGIDLLNNKSTANRESFAELNYTYSTLSSFRSSQYKLIEGVSLPVQEKEFRWFGDKAVIEIKDDSIELVIKSFLKNRTLQVLSDGETVDEFVITTKKQTFNIPLPGGKRKKTVTIKTLTPCQVPKELEINQDKRCLAFRIYNSRNVNIKNLLSSLYKEYYDLDDDPGEKVNHYHQDKSKRIIMALRKKLKVYLTDKKGSRLIKKKAKFNEKQKKVLETLGYL